MRLAEITQRAIDCCQEDLEGEETLVLRFTASFLEHPLAGQATAMLFDRESEGLPDGQVPRGFVSRRVFDESMEGVRARDKAEATRAEWWEGRSTR